jgi:hypothetical protein
MNPGPIVNLPSWVWLIYFDVVFWYVTVPAAIALMLVGWYGADWLRALRWAAFGAAALLALPFPIVGTVVVIGEIRSAANLAALERTLDRDETLAGLPLPAGSTVRFRDKERTSVASIELPRATDILGLRLVGRMDWSDYSHVWSGTLAEDQRLDGWPCRAGSIEFDRVGVVQSCELAAAHELLGLALPRGSHVARGNADRPWAWRSGRRGPCRALQGRGRDAAGRDRSPDRSRERRHRACGQELVAVGVMAGCLPTPCDTFVT